MVTRKAGRTEIDTRGIFERIYKGYMPAIVSGVNSNSQIFYSSYLSTYIERDVKELSDAIDSLKFLRFITAVAEDVVKWLMWQKLQEMRILIKHRQRIGWGFWKLWELFFTYIRIPTIC